MDVAPPKLVRPRRSDPVTAAFEGWRTWPELRMSAFADVPAAPAVYVVYRPSSNDPLFLSENPGGRFKRRDPTVALDRLSAKWVSGEHVIYIGKTDVASRRLADSPTRRRSERARRSGTGAVGTSGSSRTPRNL